MSFSQICVIKNKKKWNAMPANLFFFFFYDPRVFHMCVSLFFLIFIFTAHVFFPLSLPSCMPMAFFKPVFIGSLWTSSFPFIYVLSHPPLILSQSSRVHLLSYCHQFLFSICTIACLDLGVRTLVTRHFSLLIFSYC